MKCKVDDIYSVIILLDLQYNQNLIIMKEIILTLVLTVTCSQLAISQSPWTREKGKAYVQLGFTGLFYDEIKLDGKNEILPNDYSDVTLQGYAEYGITNKLEAQLIVPFKSVGYQSKLGSVSESLSGLGNVSLGLKYKIYDKKWKISTGLMYTANSITKDAAIELTTGFNANTFLPYLVAGSSSGKWYYFANLGYGYMDNDYSDYFKATFEVGYEIIKKGHLIFVFDTRNIVSKEDAYDNGAFQWPSNLDRQTYNAVGIKGNYEFKKDKFGANFAIIGATGIDNAPLAPTLNFGLYTKL
jgi:hypothetical protein